MSFELIPFTSELIQRQSVSEIVKCNDFTKKYGLVLTEAQAKDLADTRQLSLKNNGRIEFGGGVIDKIIREFCDSPYISVDNYAETLHGLVEMFYYYKNETMDLISDNDLIKFMRASFDGVCKGSLELLQGRELDRLAKNLRFGVPADSSEDMSSENDYSDGDFSNEEDEFDE